MSTAAEWLPLRVIARSRLSIQGTDMTMAFAIDSIDNDVHTQWRSPV
jgi:hypothetical protein